MRHRFRLVSWLTVCSGLGASAAWADPLAELWPYEAKRLDATTWEYRYDLTGLKQSPPNPDAKAEHGAEAVAAFLKGLPKEARLKVKERGSLFLSAARGVEQAPLSASFSSSPDGPLASDDPLRRKTKSRVRPALHPDEPKILPAAEMVLWRVRRLEDGALAAAALDTDRLLKAWLQTVGAQALARAKAAEGSDSRDGANELAVRFAVAHSCLDAARLQAPTGLAAEVKAQLDELKAPGVLPAATGFWAWSDELQCAFRRLQVLGRAFPPSRAGYAAGLVLLSILKEPKLKAQWLKIRGRRDALLGGPPSEPLLEYLAKAGADPDAALEDLLPAIDRQGSSPPPPLAPPRAPFGEFLSSLAGAERSQAFGELAAAVADGRLALPKETTAPVESLRQGALAAFSVADAPRAQFDAAWRDRLTSAFCALQGAHHEARESRLEPSSKEGVRNELQVVLAVPPQLEVEPLPEAFRRASDSCARLAGLLVAEGLGALTTVDPDGPGGVGAVVELKRWQSILAGLAVISARDGFETPDVGAARRFLSSWRGDSGLMRDVRFAAADPWAADGQRAHVVIAGVARRELAVQFAEPPAVEWVAAVPGLSADARVEQRYLVPVLYTLSYQTDARRPALKGPALRKAIDEVKRDPLQIPGALAK